MKSQIKVLVFTMAILAVTVPAILGAQEIPGISEKTNYAVLKLGAFVPKSSDLDKQNAGNGFTGELGFGYYVNRYFSLEAAFGYFETKGNAENTNTKFGVIPLEITGRLGLPMGILEPYLEVGLGGYSVKAEVGPVDKTTIRAGVFGGGGVNISLGKTFFIGVEARYLALSAPSGEVNVDLNGVIVTGNLGFRF